MTLAKLSSKNWTTPSALPRLSSRQWNVAGLLGLVMLALAVLQLISYKDFKGVLETIGLGGPAAWAVCLIIAEAWAGISLMKLRLPSAFRLVGMLLAILVAGFWFVENLQLISGGAAGQLPNSGYFGRYLMQSPGWWTAVEAAVFLFWTIDAVNLIKNHE